MSSRIGVGIVGVGRRAYDLAQCMARLRNEINIEVRALHNRTRSRAERVKDEISKSYEATGAVPKIRIHDSQESLVADDDVELVMICTPQYAHREPAVLALQAGKRVYVDKPLAHNLEDALAIYREQEKGKNPIIMSFTRRFEGPWITAYDLLKTEEAIGTLRMILVRNVIPYHTYFHTWHRRVEWSGGAIGDKMSHIFDVFNWYSGASPLRVSAFGGQAVFGPREDAPERCSLCTIECPYRVAGYVGEQETTKTSSQKEQKRDRPDAMVDFDESRLSESEIIKRHDTCVWYPGADINDHGLVNIEYDSGLKASLFWTLFGPDSDDQETMELVGDKGRAILTRHEGSIDLVTDYGKSHRNIDARKETFEQSHFGADDNFIRELDAFCKGAPASVTAKEGLMASRMVEAAHRSIKNGGSLVEMSSVEGEG
ncbi:MAG: Gfo/Idh/MocA family oxidoreductase [Alkalispirochaeta sp.]